MKRFALYVSLLGGLFGFAECCIAQNTTATMFGVVRDGSGAVAPQAKVTARNASTAFTRNATSDGTGAHVISNLPVGQYSLQAEKAGFRRKVQYIAAGDCPLKTKRCCVLTSCGDSSLPCRELRVHAARSFQNAISLKNTDPRRATRLRKLDQR